MAHHPRLVWLSIVHVTDAFSTSGVKVAMVCSNRTGCAQLSDIQEQAIGIFASVCVHNKL